ncbi:hypothetical protein UO65_3004 [Actinokineospora spheciospongiae]|uniref:Uncharacterized protein n=1 Tax=Actinokineospora spheciospongiae TaxID=909613 RepID=W7IYT7_9PSEU|nr:hypothetical protein [Actinokineospora spheciospongiae]EWC61646.1 hypothetical protein UO65_3004 [Actinokineospora spheciospongiae]
MDQALDGALRVLLDHDVRDPELLFTVVVEVYQDLDSAGSSDFDALRAALLDRAAVEGFPAAGEELARYAEGNGGVELFRAAQDAGVATLAAELRGMAAATEAEPEVDDTAYDEGEWAAFLQEYGPSWDGQEENWSGFVDYFLFYAAERGVAAPARSFVEYAADSGDRVGFFAGYGIAIATAAEPEAEPDPEVWAAFLAEFGPSWDGTEEAWETFTPYFLFYADERGVRSFAEAFLEHAPATTPERVEYFADYGIVIATPVPAAQSDEDDVLEALENLFSPEEIAEAQDRFGEIAQESDAIPDAAVDDLNEAFAQLVAEMPEAAALSREQMAQLLASIPADRL